MSEDILVRHCSPTLAGIKTGNLFSCYFKSANEMKDCVRCWNKQLTKKGLRVLPMRFLNSRALIYVYRPARLSVDLRDCLAERLLRDRGYSTAAAELCVVQLINRICKFDEFPHEIGLFLGYPPEDVRGFIENRSDNCKYVGCWKVYGNVKKAQKTFAKFKKCTDVYCKQYAQGKTIERLTVAG